MDSHAYHRMRGILQSSFISTLIKVRHRSRRASRDCTTTASSCLLTMSDPTALTALTEAGFKSRAEEHATQPITLAGIGQADFDGVMAAVQRPTNEAMVEATLDLTSKESGAGIEARPAAKKMRSDDSTAIATALMPMNAVPNQVSHESTPGILPALMLARAPELAREVQSSLDPSSRDRWMMKLGELRMYKAVNHTCNVPRNCKTCPQLGKWVNNQRFEYRKLTQGKPSKMTEERILLLEAEGFSWSVSEHVPWETRYQQLVVFKGKHGHCRVPKRYTENQQLANWVDKQRKEHKLLLANKKTSITQERVDILTNIGFIWIAVADIPWQTRLEQLKGYKEKYGNCLVPNKFKEENALGRWVDKQRQDYRKLKEGKKSVMVEERIRQLEELGFCWSVDEHVWNIRFKELQEYKEITGNCLVPHNYSANSQLANWVIQQRQELKKLSNGKRSAMKVERFNKLNLLNFEWNAGRSSSSIVVQTVPMEDAAAVAASQTMVAQTAMMNEVLQAQALASAQAQAKAMEEAQQAQKKLQLKQDDEQQVVLSLDTGHTQEL